MILVLNWVEFCHLVLNLVILGRILSSWIEFGHLWFNFVISGRILSSWTKFGHLRFNYVILGRIWSSRVEFKSTRVKFDQPRLNVCNFNIKLTQNASQNSNNIFFSHPVSLILGTKMQPNTFINSLFIQSSLNHSVLPQIFVV